VAQEAITLMQAAVAQAALLQALYSLLLKLKAMQ
jgi:hypothetical protein